MMWGVLKCKRAPPPPGFTPPANLLWKKSYAPRCAWLYDTRPNNRTFSPKLWSTRAIKEFQMFLTAPVATKLLAPDAVPAAFGAGQKALIFAETGLIRPAGMMLPGSGARRYAPVVGSCTELVGS